MQTLKKSMSVLLSLIMIFSVFTMVPFSAEGAEAREYQKRRQGHLRRRQGRGKIPRYAQDRQRKMGQDLRYDQAHSRR